jgi:hypothetical protein
MPRVGEGVRQMEAERQATEQLKGQRILFCLRPIRRIMNAQLAVLVTQYFGQWPECIFLA